MGDSILFSGIGSVTDWLFERPLITSISIIIFEAIRDNVTQLDESFDVVTNVLVVQNGWIDELQNRLAIAQDAVQILQKRVQSQAIVQDELRIDRLDSGVSNLTISLGNEFGVSKVIPSVERFPFNVVPYN